jgi:diacylglycerol kinase (ATP)
MVHHLGSRLLLLNPRAGAVTHALVDRLRAELPDYQVVDIRDWPHVLAGLDEPSVVVACGGDGTVGSVARGLAGTPHVLGVIAVGTFNNFARALGLPLDVDHALEVIRHGRPRPRKLGAADGQLFLEAAVLGRLAEAIEIGEAAKELRLAEVVGWALSDHSRAGFRFRITGDVRLRGTATSIVIANTPSTGALIPIADTTPADSVLELRIVTPTGPLNLLRRLLRAIFRRRPLGHPHRIRQVFIETDPPVPAIADTRLLGATPLYVRALAGALNVLLPEGDS